MSILEEYEKASRQCINKTKTSMSFRKNVPMNSRRMIKALWGAEEVSELAKYLGLPQMVGIAKSRIFLDFKQIV